MSKPPTVAFAHIESTRVSTSWQRSKQGILLHDLAHAGHITAELPWRCGSDDNLPEARNAVVRAFLDADEDWLFWIDTDMGAAPDTVDRLLAAADPVSRPIMGGLAFIFKEVTQDGLGGFDTAPVPSIFDYAEVGPGKRGFTSRNVYPVNAVTQCAATGSACILVHRSVFEKVAAEFGDCWYTRQINPETGKLMGEDVSFCVRAGAVGFPIFVHTGVRTTHHKELWVSEAQFWRQLVAPPATDRAAVIVPVMRRPQNVEPFMVSLRASTGLATAYFVCDKDDTAERAAVKAAGAREIVFDDLNLDRPGSFAEKVNVAFEMTDEPWVFLTGDDVWFQPGWLDHGQMVAKLYGARVVGTNDLHNDRVLAGEHSPHLLIARSYVLEQGASWDGPGVVCHEGYGHMFVDDEIVTVAKQRNVWGMALGSVVEHLHPVWDNAPMDEVYQRGYSTLRADQKLWEIRARKHGRNQA